MNSRICTTGDRLLASIACSLSAVFAYMGKFAITALCVFAATTLARVLFSHKDISRLLQFSTLIWPVAIFAAFGGISAAWSQAPQFALDAAVGLGLVILASHLGARSVEVLSPPASILIAGWFIIGFIVGVVALLADVATDASMQRAALNAMSWNWNGRELSWLHFSDATGKIVAISQALFKWSVAGVNLLLWPILALLVALSTGYQRRKALLIGLYIVVLVTTFASTHQTSYVAILASSMVFLAATKWPQKLVFMTASALCFTMVVIVPLANVGTNTLSLDKDARLSESFRLRLVYWGNAAKAVVDAPMLGLGAANSTAGILNGDRSDLTRHHPHNIFLQVWLELGAVGAVLFLTTGLAIIGCIRTLSQQVLPFALAAFVSAAVIFSSTWSLWHQWLEAACALALILIALADRLVLAIDLPRFNELWLPWSGGTQKTASDQ